jgi:archaemetzincin
MNINLYQSMNLSVVPVGYIPEDLLKSLKNHLKSIGFHITVSNELPIPEEAYNRKREQYAVRPFIKLANTLKGYNLLVTPVDLYAPGLNFIFGYAPGPNAVISIARLRGDLLKERTIKEAVHELGHLFSLHHCPDPRCVMHFSNSLADTDYKGKELCKRCQNLWPLKNSYD